MREGGGKVCVCVCVCLGGGDRKTSKRKPGGTLEQLIGMILAITLPLNMWYHAIPSAE